MICVHLLTLVVIIYYLVVILASSKIALRLFYIIIMATTGCFKIEPFEISDDIERWLAKFNTMCELNKWVDDETK